jgi:hypothetical protein
MTNAKPRSAAVQGRLWAAPIRRLARVQQYSARKSWTAMLADLAPDLGQDCARCRLRRRRLRPSWLTSRYD